MQNVFSQEFPARAHFDTDTSPVINVSHIWKKAFEFHVVRLMVVEVALLNDHITNHYIITMLSTLQLQS
jgi:hypothetical protein